MSRLLRFFKNVIQSLLFFLRNTSSIFVEVTNAKAIKLGKGSRIGMMGRIYTAVDSKIFIGNNVWIGRNTELQTWKSQTISIDDYVTIQDLSKILGNVEIGAYSTIASNVFISSGEHYFRKSPEMLIKLQDMNFPTSKSSVLVGEDVWIGNNVFIKNGIEIGRGSVIGANAVITKNVAPYTIAAGIPAKPIGKRLHFKPPTKINSQDTQSRIYFYSGFDHMNNFEQGMRIRKKIASIYLSTISCDFKLTLSVTNSRKTKASFDIKVMDSSYSVKFQPGVSEVVLFVKNSKKEDPIYSTFTEVFLLCLDPKVEDIYVRSANIQELTTKPNLDKS